MPDDGNRYEVIAGVLYLTPTPSVFHQWAIRLIFLNLYQQLDSKDLFVADYAQRAIDSIEGKVSAPPSGVPPDRMRADLYMLPEHCGAVAQVRMRAEILRNRLNVMTGQVAGEWTSQFAA